MSNVPDSFLGTSQQRLATRRSLELALERCQEESTRRFLRLMLASLDRKRICLDDTHSKERGRAQWQRVAIRKNCMTGLQKYLRRLRSQG